MALTLTDLPETRGKLTLQAPLAPYTWFRVGGPADALFLPADEDDLSAFLAALDPEIPVTALGVGSNVIIRDGGVAGVVVRLLGAYWGRVGVDAGGVLSARAGALDAQIARRAAELGIAGLTFLSGVPGAIGGAARTNAGCYGRELKDVLVEAEGVGRSGERVVFSAADLAFGYRHSALPSDVILTRCRLAGEAGDPDTLKAEIEALKERREAAQPIREKTGGSTFANPDPPGAEAPRSAWKLIDAAGCRDLRVGGAKVSEKHCNFLINTGEARAADLEALGELVRARVLETSGVDLRWEIRRMGRLSPAG